MAKTTLGEKLNALIADFDARIAAEPDLSDADSARLLSEQIEKIHAIPEVETLMETAELLIGYRK